MARADKNNKMKRRSARELREMFLSYFEGHGCRRYASFPLVPDDPTLLFTVAGMVPFKPYFLGLRTPEVTRAVTSQKCIRTNDIDNVGRTARHHTFFEMLGNFSFGDYFKKEIIPWAWTFLTEHVGLDPDRLYATIFLDDDEACGMWKDLVGLPDDRIYRLGEDDNFWAAGPTGPCGPCSEIIYDPGPEFSCGKPGCGVGCSCDRYLEIWNLVFMQFSRDESGTLTPLPKKNIDTGMGLERLSSVVQRVRGDFETDLFKPVIDRACELAGITYGGSAKGDLSVRVISDHLRASAFMIADGVLPANDGPGYVLRRLIRRSVRYGRMAGIDRAFLCELLPAVNEIMGDPYIELIEHRSAIEQVISLEEDRFGRTLEQGMNILDQELAKLKGGGSLPGEAAFLLYDTYGFPLELTEEIASESGISVAKEGFDREMDRQKKRARAASKQTAAVIAKNVYTELADRFGVTPFDGYESLSETAEVLAIVKGGALSDELSAGEEAEIVLSRTPFYAERGGQIGDTGRLLGEGVCFEAEDTVYPSGGLIAHRGRLSEGFIKVGATVEAAVDSKRRGAIQRHHTATHLLHESLCRVLGAHVRQAGSLVTPDFLRFDYNHFAPLTQEQAAQVESMVYEQVLSDIPVLTSVMKYSDARRLGVKALFEEKYGDTVRVLEIPGFSAELCGGTHTASTGRVGLFKITKDEGIGSGVRRITASCGSSSLKLFQESASALRAVCEALGSGAESAAARVEALLREMQELERKNQDLVLESMTESSRASVKRAVRVDGVTVVAEKFNGASRDMLRRIGDRIKRMEPDSVVLLAGLGEGEVSLVCMASDSAVKRGVHAGSLVREISAKIGGSGGGKPAMGQGGGRDSAHLDGILSEAGDMVRAQIAE
ncbi:MAG: alanine--tRNA ligase [Synergistaceae bacterium]|jgi:alanyl-tRNA synthetase|nr:alanine--tRNA ligase [Synergistaceae bacterium]